MCPWYIMMNNQDLVDSKHIHPSHRLSEIPTALLSGSDLSSDIDRECPMLSSTDISSFRKDGYILLPDFEPLSLVHAALRVINSQMVNPAAIGYDPFSKENIIIIIIIISSSIITII